MSDYLDILAEKDDWMNSPTLLTKLLLEHHAGLLGAFQAMPGYPGLGASASTTNGHFYWNVNQCVSVSWSSGC